MSDNQNYNTTNPLHAHNPKEPLMSQLEVQRLNELESVVERGLNTFYEVGMALTEIRGAGNDG